MEKFTTRLCRKKSYCISMQNLKKRLIEGQTHLKINFWEELDRQTDIGIPNLT
jgi:hypothetical protein